MVSTKPNMENATLEEVHTSMHCSPTKKGYIRLNAIYLLMQGIDKLLVAKSSLVEFRTLNRWILRFNHQGIDGLIYEVRPGRPSLISETATEKIKEYLENPQRASKEHWTLKSLHGYLKEEIDLQCSYTTFVRKIHKEGYVYRFPRQKSIYQDEQKRQEYQNRLAEWLKEDRQIWYLDETGIEGDPRPRRRWVKKGEKRSVPYAGVHIRETIIGGICPKTGEFQAIQVPYCDKEIFQIFLDYLSENVDKKRILLIMDNASWHKSKSLNWHGMHHEFLPPYSPDLNPIERIWLILKARYFTDWIARTPDELTDRITFALRKLMKNSSEVSSISCQS
jgi:transposase